MNDFSEVTQKLKQICMLYKKGEKIREIFYQKPEYELTLHHSIFVLRNDLSNKNMFNVVDKLKKEKYISSEILDGFVVD